MTEREVTVQVVGWLRAEGWIAYRKNVGMLRNGDHVTRFGTPGECDWLFVRPPRHALGPAAIEIEMKATGRKPSSKQMEYIALRKHQGLPATWCDSLEVFKRWYYLNGLDKPWSKAA